MPPHGFRNAGGSLSLAHHSLLRFRRRRAPSVFRSSIGPLPRRPHLRGPTAAYPEYRLANARGSSRTRCSCRAVVSGARAFGGTFVSEADVYGILEAVGGGGAAIRSLGRSRVERGRSALPVVGPPGGRRFRLYSPVGRSGGWDYQFELTVSRDARRHEESAGWGIPGQGRQQ
jgi:hypothetical protein